MCCLLFRERVPVSKDETTEQNIDFERRTAASVATTLNSPPKPDGTETPSCGARSLLKSASISASKCVVVQQKRDTEVISIFLHPCRSVLIYFQSCQLINSLSIKINFVSHYFEN